MFGAEWALFAEAYGVKLAFRDSQVLQVAGHGARAFVTERDVVFLAAALVGIAADFQPHAVVRFQAPRHALDDRELGLFKLGIIELKVDPHQLAFLKPWGMATSDGRCTGCGPGLGIIVAGLAGRGVVRALVRAICPGAACFIRYDGVLFLRPCARSP